ncbi:OprD family outer membrane porin [Sulfurospirillum sp. 1612]|uniref:OprD family outer membrane porin n=1 Tax=Sulfurospirillum sp. 1612 TaxID=3094835 RepID=UPI002F93852E
MKLGKLSLAAILVGGLMTSSFAADTLAGAFKEGKVKGTLKSWYFDRDNGTTSASIVNIGMTLNYVTGSFHGFSMGVTAQSSASPFADDAAKTLFKGDEYGSGAVFSEAYLKYAMGKTNIKVGRQFIQTPLVGGSGSRFIKQSFEGALVVNSDLPDTLLAAGVVTKYQRRTDFSGNVGTFDNVGDDENAYTLLAINKSIPGVKLTAQYATLKKFADLYYGEVAYAGKTDTFAYGIAANYERKDPDSSAKAGTLYGAKLSLGYDALKCFVAYSRVTDDNDVKGNNGGVGLGGATQAAYARGYQAKTGTYDRDNKAYSVDVNYNFKQYGLMLGARYTSVDTNPLYSGGKDKITLTDVYSKYKFTGALKGLYADLSYQGYGADLDGHEIWFKANYKF